MPLAGTLQDLSISSLIQIFCLERKTTRLLLKRPHEAGFIYFFEGEVWHASAGQMTGLEAVTYLLSWQFGEFHTFSREEEKPQRTIEQRWDQLLLEGMKWLDERKNSTVSELVPILSSTQRRTEEGLEEKLLRMLAELDLIYRRLYDEEMRKQPRVALEILARIANRTLAAYTEALQQIPLSEAARQAANKTLTTHFAWIPLQRQGYAIDITQLLHDFQAAGPLQRDAFARMRAQLLRIIEHCCFALIATCFQANDIKAELAETFSIFLNDLQQRLQSIEF
jgi:hypothetical protein